MSRFANNLFTESLTNHRGCSVFGGVPRFDHDIFGLLPYGDDVVALTRNWLLPRWTDQRQNIAILGLERKIAGIAL